MSRACGEREPKTKRTPMYRLDGAKKTPPVGQNATFASRQDAEGLHPASNKRNAMLIRCRFHSSSERQGATARYPESKGRVWQTKNEKPTPPSRIVLASDGRRHLSGFQIVRKYLPKHSASKRFQMAPQQLSRKLVTQPVKANSNQIPVSLILALTGSVA